MTDDRTTHQPLPVAGCTPVSDKRVQFANRNKKTEERLLRICDELKKQAHLDQRAVALAVTHFQTGFMWMNRAIFQPTRISLPEDEQDPDFQEVAPPPPNP